MTAIVTVVHKMTKVANQGQPGIEVIDVTVGDDWRRDLNPFRVGPCSLYNGHVAQNMENAWQFAKVYPEHMEDGEPTLAYWDWATRGWNDPTPRRFPMGRGRAPRYSLWDGQHLGYVEARKKIYGPLFLEAVKETEGWEHLVSLYEARDEIYLRDWDGWYMHRHGMSNLTEVLNNQQRKMGHAFFLKMMLESDPALKELAFRTPV